MTAAIIGGLISGGIALFGWFFKWKLNQAREDRRRREEAEKVAEDLAEGLRSNYRANTDHEKTIVEILSSDLSDERASELLSRPVDTGKVPGPATTKH